MSATEFSADFEAYAARNGLSTVKADAVSALLELEPDERCINVFGDHSPGRNGELLVVTSVATCCISRGLFGVSHTWTVLHASLTEVRPARGMAARHYVVDSVVLETDDELYEFRTGFNDSSYESEVKREIAQRNAETAAEEIAMAAVEARNGSSAQTAGDDGDVIHFDPEGPEKFAQQAQIAFREQEWFESFQLYVKAVDKLHDFYVYEQFKHRQPSPGDAWIVQGVASSLGITRQMAPNAPIVEGVKEVTHRLRTISTAVDRAGGNSSLYRHALDEVGRLTPDIDVSDIFWE